MCVDNAGSYDPRNPATDRRLTMYWIGWVFFGITITSIFIAGVMVSMYKMNIQDSQARSYEDYDDVTKDGADDDGIGSRRSEVGRRQGPRHRAKPNRGPSRPQSGGTVTYNVSTAHRKPNGNNAAPPDHDRNPSTILIDDEEPTNEDHGS